MMLTATQTTHAVDAPPEPPVEKIGKAFYLIWSGQFISTIGTMLTSFAVGVWLFQQTASVLNYTQLTMFATLPALLLMPWTGSMADRWNKKAVLMIGEALALVCTAAMGLMFYLERFEVWQLYALQVVLSVSMAFQAPAAYAAVSVLVPKSQFGRASGMFQLSTALAQLGAPLVAASLLAAIGITGIVLMDVISFAAALLGLALARFPAAARATAESVEASKEATRGAFRDLKWALRYLLDRPTLAILYGYTSMGAFLSGMVVVMISPMVLSNYSPQVLAWITTCGAFGILGSGLVMVAWGGPKNWTPLVLGFNLVEGLAIAAAGYFYTVPVMCIAAVVVMLCSSCLSGCMAGVWRRKLPKDRQGSFGAFQQAVALALMPLSAFIGGMLAHHFFEPALMPGGVLFDSVGQWFGTGKGRGVGLLFVVTGLLAAVVSLFSLMHRRLYRFENEVPDAL
jgi:MFS family permease